MGTLRKSALLGMPFGTAMNKLRRQIMFQLVIEAERTGCFVCGEEMTADTFSIEHIVPWESTDDPLLFWDLGNITFSHRRCNYGGRAYIPVKRDLCKRGHPLTHWRKDRRGKTYCRTCKTAWDRRKRGGVGAIRTHVGVVPELP